MRKVLFIFLLFPCYIINAQYERSATVKLFAGYTHDFPGLNGYGAAIELDKPFTENMEVAVGMKHFDLKGFPRTTRVEEYTRANTLDFSLFLLPLQSETQRIRVGAGYSFSFYSIRRSFPVISQDVSGGKNTSWPVKETRGRTSGVTFTAEYEYLVPGTGLSFGLRAALYKAYDRVSSIGPFAGLSF